MKLNRNRNQRKALVRTQLNALVNLGHLTTTLAKAKMMKPLFDKLITRAKVGTVASRRLLARDLASVASANRLVDVIAPLFPDRVSGYTSSTKNKIRRGDAVTMVTLKLMADLPVPVVKEEKKVKVDKKVATKTTEKKVKTAKK
ncbi:MAG TPA: 50S ribosomal protein L17 [Patescibacteria group bacterium]|nr:50S ribosomal protein L17 [Patescibacteria group bacterium]